MGMNVFFLDWKSITYYLFLATSSVGGLEKSQGWQQSIDISQALIALAAVFAVFVSICSFIVSIKALKIHREHYQKSVRPIGQIVFSDYENDIAIDIRNAGIGPLLIENLKVFNEQNEVKESVFDWMIRLPEGIKWSNFVQETKGRAIVQGEKLNLLRLQGDSEDNLFREYRDKVRKILRGLTIELEYKDIYENRMPSARRSLDWFGRTLKKGN